MQRIRSELSSGKIELHQIHCLLFQQSPRGAKLTVYNTVTPVEKVYRSSVGSVQKRRTIEKGEGKKFQFLASFPSPNSVYTPFRSGSHGGVCKLFTRRDKLSIIKAPRLRRGFSYTIWDNSFQTSGMMFIIQKHFSDVWSNKENALFFMYLQFLTNLIFNPVNVGAANM